MSADNVDGVSVADSPVQPSDTDRMSELTNRKQRLLENSSGWVQDGDYDESVIFNQMFDEAMLSYFGEVLDRGAQGRQVPRFITKWKPVVEAFVQLVLHDTDALNDALDAELHWEPEGRGEAIIRPLIEDTFDNGSYTQTLGDTGQSGLIPDDSQANGNGYTFTASQQAAIIIGYIDYNAGNEIPYDYIQEDVDDSMGVRRPIVVKNQTDMEGAMKVIDRHRAPLPVLPGETVDIDFNQHTANVKTGLWPVGIEVIIETDSKFGGVLDS